MTSEIALTTVAQAAAEVANHTGLVAAAVGYARQAKAANTTRAYAADWRDFAAWCGTNQVLPLPAGPETVVLYITRLAGERKVSTIRRRLAAITQAHQAAGFHTPVAHHAVRTVMKGIARQHGTRPVQKAAVCAAELKALLASAAVAGGLQAVRDQALLLVGFASALRRSELVGLDVGDARMMPDQGMILVVRRGKTDATGAGREIGVPYGKHPETCPVLALQRYLQQAGIASGPVFRPLVRGAAAVREARLSDRAVARIVQRYAKAAGLDPARYGGHSLRAGFVTAAAAAGVPEHAIQEVTGHRSVQILRGYVRQATLFAQCPLREMDL